MVDTSGALAPQCRVHPVRDLLLEVGDDVPDRLVSSSPHLTAAVHQNGSAGHEVTVLRGQE